MWSNRNKYSIIIKIILKHYIYFKALTGKPEVIVEYYVSMPIETQMIRN